MQDEDIDDPEQIEEMLGSLGDYDENGDEGIDSDDDEAIDLEERIKGLNLDNADQLWNALTEDERNEFEAMLSQGDVGSIIPQWEPWWSYFKEEKLIQDVDKKDTLEADALKKCPLIIKVPEFTKLTVSIFLQRFLKINLFL